MGVESAADRAVFVEPGDFGRWALYGDAQVAVAGVFDDGSRDQFDGPGAVSSAPRFVCRSADLPSGASGGDDGDGIRILPPGVAVTDAGPGDGETFVVRVIRPDGTGMSALQLQQAE